MMDIFMNQYHMKLMGLKWNVKSLLHYHFIKQTKCGIVQNYQGEFMKWQVDMKVKDYIRNWSDQEIHTEYKC